MNIEIQTRIKNNKNYIKYLRENSNWYKLLNRNRNNFKLFENEVKENYKLRPTDKIGNIIETIDMIQTILTK